MIYIQEWPDSLNKDFRYNLVVSKSPFVYLNDFLLQLSFDKDNKQTIVCEVDLGVTTLKPTTGYSSESILDICFPGKMEKSAMAIHFHYDFLVGYGAISYYCVV